jgi:UDP-N-acetylmuramoyl-L-alanyl-D-glutamate--2,6-diaminopimelate ligase
LAADLAASAAQTIGYGVGNPVNYPANTLVATDTVFDHTGIRAKVISPWGEGVLQVPVLGRFNLHNLLAALGVLLAKGVPMTQALACLQHVWVVPGRMERVSSTSLGGSEKSSGKLVVVDYAHTPGALQQVLAAARVHTAGRLLCVFGCGGDRDRGKRPLMAQMAESGADVEIGRAHV